MKTTRMCYNDDGVLIPGVLIQRLFRKPVFVSVEPGCGWDTQTICSKAEGKNLHPYTQLKLTDNDIFHWFIECQNPETLRYLGRSALKFAAGLEHSVGYDFRLRA